MRCPSILLLFSISFVFSEKCFDQSDFCRYLKSFCTSKDHESLMMVKCAATCGFCKEEKDTTELLQVIFPKNTTQLRNRPNITEETTTTPKKCVFPKEKMITATPDNKTEFSFSANVSVVQKSDETIQTIVVQTRNSTRPKSIPDSNEALKRIAQAKRVNDLDEVTAQEEMSRSRVMKKIKQNQLIDDKDLAMPRITTADPSKFSVSLAKTLIKGKCFDEYMYCAEFSTLCTHPAFGDVMASHCTLTCKRCDDVDQEDEKDSTSCVDTIPNCSQYADVCHDESYAHLTREYCAKTCGHCKPLCRDRHKNCAQFALDGFCSDETYTTDERQFLCGASCGTC